MALRLYLSQGLHEQAARGRGRGRRRFCVSEAGTARGRRMLFNASV